MLSINKIALSWQVEHKEKKILVDTHHLNSSSGDNIWIDLGLKLIEEILQSCNYIQQLQSLTVEIGDICNRLGGDLDTAVREKFLLINAEILTKQAIVPFLWQASNIKFPLTTYAAKIIHAFNEEMNAALFGSRLVSSEYSDIILAPWLAAQFVHEVVGHTLEADNFLHYLVPAGIDVGDRISPYPFSVADDPTQLEMHASYLLDDEGVQAKHVQLVKNGIITSTLNDEKTARFLGMPQNGHGRRAAIVEKISPRMSITSMEAGTESLAALFSGIENGLFCVGTWGGGSAGLDFILRPAYARRIHDGKLTDEYIRRFDIVGNKLDALARLDGVSTDLVFHQPFFGCQKNSPSLLPVSMAAPHLRLRGIKLSPHQKKKGSSIL